MSEKEYGEARAEKAAQAPTSFEHRTSVVRMRFGAGMRGRWGAWGQAAWEQAARAQARARARRSNMQPHAIHRDAVRHM